MLKILTQIVRLIVVQSLKMLPFIIVFQLLMDVTVMANSISVEVLARRINLIKDNDVIKPAGDINIHVREDKVVETNNSLPILREDNLDQAYPPFMMYAKRLKKVSSKSKNTIDLSHFDADMYVFFDAQKAHNVILK